MRKEFIFCNYKIQKNEMLPTDQDLSKSPESCMDWHEPLESNAEIESQDSMKTEEELEINQASPVLDPGKKLDNPDSV